MTRQRWMVAALAFALGVGPWLSGCSKRVPIEEGTFEAQERIVLDFNNERSVSGKIDQDSKVTYRDQGNEFSARIKSLSEDTIVLENLILVQSSDPVQETQLRLADARVVLQDPLPNVVLSRGDIEAVNRLEFDAPRTFKHLSFWSLSAAVLALILGERS